MLTRLPLKKDLYSKEAIEEAMQKIRNANKAEESYGDSDDSGWGDSSLGEADEEDEEW